MDFWDVVLWIVFGGLAGWIASKIVGKDSQLGVVGNVIVGVVGAFIAGAILPHDADRFDFGSFVAAVVGACLLLLVVNFIEKRLNKRLPRV